MTRTGRLYMIPTPIAEETQDSVLPDQVVSTLRHLRFFLAEDVRTARRFLSGLKIFESIEDLQFRVLNKDSTAEEMAIGMEPILRGEDVGVLSESGCPGVADPGALAVAYAHRNDIQVIPLVGPSSILLALMASGLNGQQFAFHGYLPVETGAAAKAIAELERESRVRCRTQIFIETPYRNNSILKSLLSNLQTETRLCIALDLTSPMEKIGTRTIGEWRKKGIELPKRPAIFLFLASPH